MRAIFLDRDGVICENRSDHVKSWDEFRFLPGALAGLAQLSNSGFAQVVVTNQAIINRGTVPAGAVHDIHVRMLAEVAYAGGYIDRVIICPHLPEEDCACRKPKPGMILQAAAEMGIDLSRSYLIGDATTDMQAGLAAGLTCFMVMTGRGMKQSGLAMSRTELSFHFARDLQHAVEMILYLEAFGGGRLTPFRAARAPASPTRPLAMTALPVSSL